MALDRDTVLARVIELAASQLDAANPAGIDEDTSFVGDLGADSLDTTELLLELENEFGVMVPENERDIRTVGDAVRFILANAKD